MRRCIRQLRQGLPIVAILLLVQAARAADAVEDLRQALRTPFPPTASEKELDYQLKYRRELLEKRVKALGIGDLRRALSLQEWRDQDRDLALRDLDRSLRDELVGRLQKSLQELLQAKDPAARRAAITQIGALGVTVRGSGDAPLARALAPDLVRLFDDPAPIIRIEAVQAFSLIDPDQKLVLEAGKLLNDRVPAVRLAAAEALANVVRTLEPLIKSRGTTGIEVSRAEAAMLARAAALASRGGVGQDSPAVRQASLDAIYRSAILLRELVLDPTRQDFPPADRKPTEDERTEIERYRRIVEDERADVMPLAKGLEELTPVVIGALNDPQTPNRLLAAHALEEIGVARLRLLRKAQSVPRLAQPKEEEKKEEKKEDKKDIGGAARRPTAAQFVSFQAQADALDLDPLRAGLVAGIPAIAASLSDPSVDVRRTLVNVLETLSRDPEISSALPAITRALADRDVFVRWSSARLIGRIGPVQAEATVPALARLLTDGDLDVQMAAATALGRLGAKASPAVANLSQQVSQGDPENRVSMIHALQAIAAPTDGAVAALAAALSDVDPRVREASASALRSFGPAAKAAIPQLEQTLNDPNDDVRKAVSDALLAVTAK